MLTRHGRECVEGGAGKGDENRFAIQEAGELVVVEDGELRGGEVKPLAGLANEIAYVKVGLIELRGRRLRRGGSRRAPRGGKRGEVFHRHDGGSGTRSLKGR